MRVLLYVLLELNLNKQIKVGNKGMRVYKFVCNISPILRDSQELEYLKR